MSIFDSHNLVYVPLSSVAQWQSNRLLTDRSLVRIQPGELDLSKMRTLTVFAFFISGPTISNTYCCYVIV